MTNGCDAEQPSYHLLKRLLLALSLLGILSCAVTELGHVVLHVLDLVLLPLVPVISGGMSEQ